MERILFKINIYLDVTYTKKALFESCLSRKSKVSKKKKENVSLKDVFSFNSYRRRINRKLL